VGLRKGDWKIVGSDNLKTFELYNLKEDPRETTNLASKFPERFATMRAKLIAHDQSVLADGPDWWKNDEPR